MCQGIGMQSSVVNAVWSLCTCLYYSSHSWSTLAEEPQCHPTLSSVMGISLPLPVFPEVYFCLARMEISLVPRRTFLPRTNDGTRASFHVPTLSLALRGTLMRPQQKVSSFDVVWVSKFPSLSLLQQHRCSHCGVPPEALPSRAARACHPLCQIRRLSFLWTATLKRWGRGQWSF